MASKTSYRSLFLWVLQLDTRLMLVFIFHSGWELSFTTKFHQVMCSTLCHAFRCDQHDSCFLQPVDFFHELIKFTYSSFFEYCSKLSLECKKKMATKLEIFTQIINFQMFQWNHLNSGTWSNYHKLCKSICIKLKLDSIIVSL